MARSVKPPTLEFGSGHDLTVYETKPGIELCAGSVEPAWDSLSPSLSAPPPLAHGISLPPRIDKLKRIKNVYTSKDPMKMKRQATEWEKIFTKQNLIKDLHPEYVKNSYKSMLRQFN